MIRIAVGYVAIVVLCAVVILLNPMDFMGREAREAMLQEAPARRLADATVAPPAVPNGQADSVAAISAAVLADLRGAAERGDDGAAPAVLEGDAALARMSAAVLDSLRGSNPAPDEPQTLEGLVALALAEGQTDQTIDEIVNQAVAEGEIEAPAMLTTTEGKVDTAVLLASIIAEAQGDEVGQGDISDPTEAVDGGTLAMQVATQDVLYVVQAGDSLGSLALRFYGDADLNGAIFKANRQVLDSPESLRAGVKLLIPARSGL